MIKKILAGAAVAALIAAGAIVAGAGSETADGQSVTEIRVAFNQNEQHPQYLAMKELGEKFEEATDGRYHMTIYANGVLGEQGAMAELIRTAPCRWQSFPAAYPKATTETLRL